MTSPRDTEERMRGPRITGLTVSDILCDDLIDVTYEKDTDSEATLTLTSTSASHPVVDPPSETIHAILPNGTKTFHLTHDMTADETGVTITARITQGASSASRSATASVKCKMMAEARKIQNLAGPPFSLDPAIEKPIHLVRGQDKVLLGKFRPDIGDSMWVEVRRIDSSGAVSVCHEFKASLSDIPKDDQKLWSIALDHLLWGLASGRLPANIRLVLMKGKEIKWAKTFRAVIVCESH